MKKRHKGGSHGSKMPNQGSDGKPASGTGNTGASTGLTMSNEMRADVTKPPSNKNPYPKGLA